MDHLATVGIAVFHSDVLNREIDTDTLGLGIIPVQSVFSAHPGVGSIKDNVMQSDTGSDCYGSTLRVHG